MIISHKYKCIMVHIPKTAGKSLSNLFYELDPEYKEAYEAINLNWSQPPGGHMSAAAIRSKIGDEIYDEYFKFVFIRNPYDWFKSYYLHHCHSIFEGTTPISWLLYPNDTLPLPINGEITADHFMRCYSMGKYWFNNTGDTSNNIHTRIGNFSQLGWIDDVVDYVASYDNLNEEFEFIKNKLGLPIESKMPHIRDNESYDGYLNSDVIQLISILFKDDIQFYNKKTNEHRY